MVTKSEDNANFTSFIELFGTFFEKITINHPHKDPLQKELAEFKSVLYNNPTNVLKIDTYLDSLLSKPPILPAGNIKITIPVSYSNTNSASPPKTRTGSDTSPCFKTKTGYTGLKKLSIVPLLDFMKYRSLGRSAKKQNFLNQYSHVQYLQNDPANLFKLIAISWFTMVIQSPGATRNLSDIIDEVAAKRIELKSPVENLAHEDLCGLFCGFFAQLIRMKRQQSSITKIIDTFYQMISSEDIFSLSLACFVKSKVFMFTNQKQLPYELLADASLSSLLKSIEFKEKVENNDPSQLKTVLRIIPFVFNQQVVLYEIESDGKTRETAYKTSATHNRGHEKDAQSEESPVSTHFLIEKTFSSMSFFALVPHTTGIVDNKNQQIRPNSSHNVVGETAKQEKVQVRKETTPPSGRNSKNRALTVNTTALLSPKAAQEIGSASHKTARAMDNELLYENEQTSEFNQASVTARPSYTNRDSLGRALYIATGEGRPSDIFRNESSININLPSNRESYREISVNEKENNFGNSGSPAAKPSITNTLLQDLITKDRVYTRTSDDQPHSAKIRYNHTPDQNSSFNASSPLSMHDYSKENIGFSDVSSAQKSRFSQSKNPIYVHHSKTNSSLTNNSYAGAPKTQPIAKHEIYSAGLQPKSAGGLPQTTLSRNDSGNLYAKVFEFSPQEIRQSDLANKTSISTNVSSHYQKIDIALI